MKTMNCLLIMLVMFTVLKATSGMTLCDMTEDGLESCKPSVSKPDPVAPTAECCKALSTANLTCLCSYKGSFVLPSLGIDPDLAMLLPAKCSLAPPAGC